MLSFASQTITAPSSFYSACSVPGINYMLLSWNWNCTHQQSFWIINESWGVGPLQDSSGQDTGLDKQSWKKPRNKRSNLSSVNRSFLWRSWVQGLPQLRDSFKQISVQDLSSWWYRQTMVKFSTSLNINFLMLKWETSSYLLKRLLWRLKKNIFK